MGSVCNIVGIKKGKVVKKKKKKEGRKRGVGNLQAGIVIWKLDGCRLQRSVKSIVAQML
jgi:hypothetical protein